MKSDLPLLTSMPNDAQLRGHEGLDYPFRLQVLLASALALILVWFVARIGPVLAWLLSCAVVFVAMLLVVLYTRRISIARRQGAQILCALGQATAGIPVDLRTRMPLVLVTGDDLPALFNRNEGERFAYVGEGAIWLRVDSPKDLARLAIAVKQWRDGRAPDGVVVSVVPARYTDVDLLTQSLRAARQAVADATRMLGARALPGYVAVYQRLTTETAGLAGPQWHGVSSATRMVDAQRFETVIRAAEDEIMSVPNRNEAATRAAALASLIGWTQRVVLHALTDPRQPAMPLALFGAGWIDCGPAGRAGSPWNVDVEMQTSVVRNTAPASPAPWPLPQPLIEALPVRHWRSPRLVALIHALAMFACAAGIAFCCAGKNNQTLLSRIQADLGRYSNIPADHDAARREALRTLVNDRDELDRYARTGVPLDLSFGLYRGARLIPALNNAIASYQPPPPPPAVLTLDSMSLFDSGKAQLKDGSTRIMVNALEMIKAHPDKRILVAGHTDNVGKPDSNLLLSTARAQAVRNWLVDASGIPATQFAIQGYGDTRPLTENDTDAGRARNRRVEITLVPDAAQPAPAADTSQTAAPAAAPR
ncbi:OmpA family protein [Paraburkholderia sp. CNPSo 3281]|uniref:OmpA family protein n=1 Tax=Paraburkholderia sp. CNPSo 3281 TaxID=2940933 RepID=UPI0020B85BB4|nr:OmpA family protein [Paraburkholderia sp. CNPSo 3281]MCP3715983.1 OmpA family protein [Paraburkholderia sp. CNPSo 3281]